MNAPDPITVHQLLTRAEVLQRTSRPLPLSRFELHEYLVREVEAETLRRAATLTRELEVLLPFSGTVRESVAIALERRASAAAQAGSQLVTDAVLARTAHLRRVS